MAYVVDKDLPDIVNEINKKAKTTKITTLGKAKSFAVKRYFAADLIVTFSPVGLLLVGGDVDYIDIFGCRRYSRRCKSIQFVDQDYLTGNTIVSKLEIPDSFIESFWFPGNLYGHRHATINKPRLHVADFNRYFNKSQTDFFFPEIVEIKVFNRTLGISYL